LTALRSLEEGISICCENIEPLESEYRHIDEAYMRVTAEDIASHINVPSFDRSLMDGYAIGHSDMEKLKTGSSLKLSVTATIVAGSTEGREIRNGETFRIMTGALLPAGCVAVVKQEDVQIDNDFIIVSGNWREDENIQRAGQELRAGDKITAKGRVLNAEILERIAACGIERILVHKIPRIYVINTGSELLLPGSPVKAGQIYNSNRSLISAKIASIETIPVLADSIIKDELPTIVNEIEKAAVDSDMVIITGGTGEGVHDLVYKAFESLNAKILFRGINIIPGKKTTAALFNGRLLFNLSGNSCSAGLLFEALIKPVLLKLKGELFSNGQWFDIPLSSPIKYIKPERCLYRGEMVFKQGQIFARPVSRKNIDIKNISLVLDLQAGQGIAGDMVKAKIY
jgi:molybdopterin molybdotransferase